MAPRGKAPPAPPPQPPVPIPSGPKKEMRDEDFAKIYCGVIYNLIGKIAGAVEGLPNTLVVKEDARRMVRLVKRIEILLTDLEPYVTEPTTELVTVFKAIQDVMQFIVTIVRNLSVKGPLAIFMAADRTLQSFQEATGRLDECLAAINGRLPEETLEELVIVRALLKRTVFELPPEHGATMKLFREGVDQMFKGHKKMSEAASKIITVISPTGSDQLTKEGYLDAMRELMTENDVVISLGDKYNDSLYLRTMLDQLRIHHKLGSDTPLAYICPLSHQLMIDPVVIAGAQSEGYSYDRAAINNWFQKGHRICPRSNKPIGTLTGKLPLVPNPNLKEAIDSWKLYGNLSVAFRPLMQTFAAQGKVQVQIEAVREHIALEMAHEGEAPVDVPVPGTGGVNSATARASGNGGIASPPSPPPAIIPPPGAPAATAAAAANSLSTAMDPPPPPLPVSQFASDGLVPVLGAGAPVAPHPVIRDHFSPSGSMRHEDDVLAQAPLDDHYGTFYRGPSSSGLPSVSPPSQPALSTFVPLPPAPAQSAFTVPLPASSGPTNLQAVFDATLAEAQLTASHNSRPISPPVLAPPPVSSSSLPPLLEPSHSLTAPSHQQAEEEEDMFAGCEMQDADGGADDDEWGAPVQAEPTQASTADEVEEYAEWHTGTAAEPMPAASASLPGDVAGSQGVPVLPDLHEPLAIPLLPEPLAPTHATGDEDGGFADLAAQPAQSDSPASAAAAPGQSHEDDGEPGDLADVASTALPPPTFLAPQLEAEAPSFCDADAFTPLAATGPAVANDDFAGLAAAGPAAPMGALSDLPASGGGAVEEADAQEFDDFQAAAPVTQGALQDAHQPPSQQNQEQPMFPAPSGHLSVGSFEAPAAVSGGAAADDDIFGEMLLAQSQTQSALPVGLSAALSAVPGSDPLGGPLEFGSMGESGTGGGGDGWGEMQDGDGWGDMQAPAAGPTATTQGLLGTDPLDALLHAQPPPASQQQQQQAKDPFADLGLL